MVQAWDLLLNAESRLSETEREVRQKEDAFRVSYNSCVRVCLYAYVNVCVYVCVCVCVCVCV